MIKKFICFSLLVLALFAVGIAGAEQVYIAHTKADLVSDHKSVQPGKSVPVALHLVTDPEWHVYWKNPGDSGLAPTIKWQLPEGFIAGEIQWPVPHRIVLGPLTTFGYEGEVFLISTIHVPEGLTEGQNVEIKARADWLTCKVECIPGRADFTLTLPVKAAEPELDPAISSKFFNTFITWPVQSEGWDIKVDNRPKELVLTVTSVSDQRPIKDLFFYPDREDMILHAEPQVLKPVQNGVELTVPKSNLYPKNVESLKGILVRSDGWKPSGDHPSMIVSASLAAPLAVAPAVAPQVSLTVFAACMFAFLGGLILNLMPCVLPVLSLKILGLVKHVSDRRLMLMHGFLFTAGVLVSFWILAAALIVLQKAGQGIGWGFQFQSPAFVVFIAALLLVIALNLFGLFEVAAVFSGEGRSGRRGYAASFWGGVLATVVASPCTAPFMGAALGFALSQPPSIAILVFTFLGLGMAFPYLFLSAFPQFLKWVPKPGIWMTHMKTVLGFLLLASVVWLVWVLGVQKGVTGICLFLSGALFVGLGCWFVGLIQQEQPSWGIKLMMIAVYVAGAGLMIAATLTPSQALVASSAQISEQGIVWKNFTPELVRDLRAQNKPVFIDFTAAWCLSCQVNDRLVFHHHNVEAVFKELNIEAVKADWTNKDPAITEALSGYGKSSIPLYVFYPAGSETPVILPELVTPGLVIELLRKAVEKH